MICYLKMMLAYGQNHLISLDRKIQDSSANIQIANKEYGKTQLPYSVYIYNYIYNYIYIYIYLAMYIYIDKYI